MGLAWLGLRTQHLGLTVLLGPLGHLVPPGSPRTPSGTAIVFTEAANLRGRAAKCAHRDAPAVVMLPVTKPPPPAPSAGGLRSQRGGDPRAGGSGDCWPPLRQMRRLTCLQSRDCVSATLSAQRTGAFTGTVPTHAVCASSRHRGLIHAYEFAVDRLALQSTLPVCRSSADPTAGHGYALALAFPQDQS